MLSPWATDECLGESIPRLVLSLEGDAVVNATGTFYVLILALLGTAVAPRSALDTIDSNHSGLRARANSNPFKSQ